MVQPGTFKEAVETDHGIMAVYEDPFDGEVIFVREEIKGYRVKKPDAITPEEPEATVTNLFDKK